MEKLKLKTEEAERKMKERLNDIKLEDDKQKQKNNQALKEMHGACESTEDATASFKIPKLPTTSFTDLIQVPGAKTKESKKETIIVKDKNDQTGKGDRDIHKKPDGSNSEKKVIDDDFKDNATRFGEFSKPETKEMSPVKERRHRVKVYVSTKSKNMDLFETMMKGAKIKPKLISADNKPDKSSKSGSFESVVSDISTSSSKRAATKRLTIDSATKTGATKKLKFDGTLSKDKEKDSKDKSSEDKKGKDEENSANNRNIIKPMINCHRGILAAANTTTSDLNKSAATAYLVGSVNAISAAATTTTDTNSGNVGDSSVIDMLDYFAPEEGKLKSSLRIIPRPKGTAKKLVRWREDEELKEFHCFETDETEVVNVTKQIQQFSEMKFIEISEEKSSNSRISSLIQKGFGNQSEERFSWLKPRPIILPEGKVYHEANSKEEHIQDERERSVHEVFYPPGSNVPDHPSEVDVVNMEIDLNHIPTMISADDVPVVTKVCDYRSKPSPRPNVDVGIISSPNYQSSNPDDMQSSIAPNNILVPTVDPILAFANASYNPAAQQIGVGVGNMNIYNTWVSTKFQSSYLSGSPTRCTDAWKMAQEVTGFPGFQAAGNAPQINAFQPLQTCGFSSFHTLPPTMGNMEIFQMEQQPHLSQPQPVSPPENFGAFGMPQQFDPTLNTGEDSGPHRYTATHTHTAWTTQQQGQGQGVIGSGDVDYRELLRNDGHSDPVIRGIRNRYRGYHRRPRRGGSRGRDRKSDRAERYDNGRGYSRSNDRAQRSYKGPSGGRRQQKPCYYFAKGFCRDGNKCPFLHLGGVDTPTINSNSLSTIDNANNSRRPPSSPPSSSSGRYYEKTRRRSPPWTNTELPANYLKSSPPNNALSIDSSSYSSNRPLEILKIESRSPETDRFDFPSSSPSENHNHPPETDEIKFIPTFTEEDWI